MYRHTVVCKACKYSKSVVDHNTAVIAQAIHNHNNHHSGEVATIVPYKPTDCVGEPGIINYEEMAKQAIRPRRSAQIKIKLIDAPFAPQPQGNQDELAGYK